MNYNVIYLAKEALLLSLILSLPIIIVASLVGFLFSLFQALTQIQDQTLSFSIKLIFIILTIYLSVDWMAAKIYRFTLILYAGG
jgi:type III secretion protein S